MSSIETPHARLGILAPADVDVVIVGGGQSALAVAYYLRRTGLSYVLLDASALPGGAWRHTWRSLRLFSPAQWSSLPGRLMPGGTNYYPTRDEALAYLTEYEARYAAPVIRPVRVTAVRGGDGHLGVETDVGRWRARAVVSATGTWSAPNVPHFEGEEIFRGRIIHSASYRSPDDFAGGRVVVVGGGNSGAQIVADLSDNASVTWATRRPPSFLPDDIDGRYLFGEETARYRALTAGVAAPPARTLGEIVMVEPVRRARDRGVLTAVPMFTALTPGGVRWPDGREAEVDAIVLATGFRPALGHLASLAIAEPNGRIAVRGTRSVREPRLWLVGYGDWTGYASATLIGVGRSARAT
ncbi:MAG TPA: ArsO family NAD(P)H-dependent flavin-containing monooxygenase, partial [Gemmatimonadaceae bacterium]|nr:ArsO family NAD(P)H-dependent flavin-containing monooxygenase [Gemmatimonadaceae bacterium]